MSYTITHESFDSLTSCWTNPSHRLKWNSIFVLPAWLKVWWQELGTGAELHLDAIRQEREVIGIAPLLVNKETASFIGSADVCDYLDFVIAPGREKDFFSVLLDDLRQKGINQLDLRPLRPDSTVLSHLVSTAQNRGYEVLCHPEDVSLELDLPANWDEYLATLNKKQRHEVRRKLRRLWEAGNVEHRCVEAGREVEDYLDIFLKLFSLSRDEKASFMNPKMESFFRSLAKAMAEIGLLRLGIIQLDKAPVAMTMGFDYNDAHYLYNSAYDPQFNYLSVGLLCKVLCLKESIEKGRKKWDFLKGGEPYKYQLGGQEIPLYSCQITIK
ncbi:MAG TPA: GNAT family N-acetyltransferase [Dehalococcoidales bacterium]|nr:GNAT family N-acetyltransferase [Dehalococcoidales bacterium]